MSRRARDETVEPVSRDQILRAPTETGEGKHFLPCSADHEQDWQSYLVDPYIRCSYMKNIDFSRLTNHEP